MEDPGSKAKRIRVAEYSELVERIASKRPGGGDRVSRELEGLQRVHDVAVRSTDFIRDLVKLLDSMHPFYWSLIEIEFDRSEIRASIKCLAKARKVSGRLVKEYKTRVLAAKDSRELSKISREGRGRILSGFRRCRRGLRLLKRLVEFMRGLPGIDPSTPTIIVAGPPSSGKSSFVKSVSTAKPKVAPYPFTTRNIIVGHRDFEGLRFQVIDTPGLLDRPLDSMSPIEKRAAAALREIPGSILFLLDPSEGAYMPLERQLEVLANVTRLVPDKRVYLGINKADISPESSVKEAIRLAGSALSSGKISGFFRLVAIDKDSALRVFSHIAASYKTREGRSRP